MAPLHTRPPCRRYRAPYPQGLFGLLQVLMIYFVFVIAITSVASWDSDGHQAVGMTAMSALNVKATAQVKRLMTGKDVVDVGGWHHRVAVKYPQVAPLFYQHQPAFRLCAPLQINEESCPENQCLVRALQHFYGRLTGRPRLIQLKYPHNLQLTDSDAVKFLVNLIADLHQPLHCGFLRDAGGKNISITYTNHKREKRPSSLYTYWDTDLIQKFIHERSSYWNGGWTHAQSLGARLSELRKEWEEHPAQTRHELFQRWAGESLATSCSMAYQNVQNGQDIVSGFDVPIEVEYYTFDIIKNQILTAGARIAFVLNSILAERDASKLRQGSGLEVPVIEDNDRAGGSAFSKQKHLRGFCINLFIIVIILSVFAYVTRFYSTSPGLPAVSPSLPSRAAALLTSKDADKRS